MISDDVINSLPKGEVSFQIECAVRHTEIGRPPIWFFKITNPNNPEVQPHSGDVVLNEYHANGSSIERVSMEIESRVASVIQDFVNEQFAENNFSEASEMPSFGGAQGVISPNTKNAGGIDLGQISISNHAHTMKK